MADQGFTDAHTRTLRGFWFSYLDVVEPFQADLHRYGLKLTGNVWDAEDLVQETLLRGFSMTARGDFHGNASRVRNARAYLFRTATNLWIDRQRHARWQGDRNEPVEPSAPDADPVSTREALTTAAGLASPQEFAALLLKDVYDFTLKETADFIGSTPGTVKSALHRVRRKLRQPAGAAPVDGAVAELVGALVDAMNSGDVDRVLGLMSESVKIDVCNVGGGRGRSGVWTARTLAASRFRYGELEGAPLVLLLDEDLEALSGLVRPEVAGGTVTRLIDYHYAPNTLAYVAAGLGFECRARGYHQRDELPEMLASTRLPWIPADAQDG